MYVTETHTTIKGKTYRSVLLRESYRQEGKVKNRTIANLSQASPEEVAAIRLALKHKGDLSQLGSLKQALELHEGQSIGAAWAVYDVARRLGIEKALGKSRAGKLALWQVIARVLEQGSRLSAVRLAKLHGLADVLQLERGFDENDLYDNLTWLAQHQAGIEKRLLRARCGQQKPELFFYDVTSSYLEGEQNAYAAYGYNRDRKRGKKQIVIGLLCDEAGEPVSTEVFAGNTADVKTFSSQVQKAAEMFGCERVTFVGDRGMIKSGPVEELGEAGFHYITALTKPQIESLLKAGVLQLGLFDEQVCEVEHEGLRYVLRRNPDRALQMAETRRKKRVAIAQLVGEKNIYLSEHRRAKVEVALRHVEEKIEKLKVGGWLKAENQGRELRLREDEAALARESMLDGCYVLKSDLASSSATMETIHDRYKDLTQVEQAFRTMKTGHLEVRPIYVRKKCNTRGHVLVVMLAYLVSRELRRVWAELDVKVEEGLLHLTTLCSTKVVIKGRASYHQIPKPRELSAALLKGAGVRLPLFLPHREVNVVTRTKLPSRRKTP